MKILKSYCLAIILTILVFQTIVDAAPKAEADALDTINININLEGAKGLGSGPDPILCGVKKKSTGTDIKIVGGNETEVNEYPWIVQIFVFDTYRCGGSVIADKWILTAAHCVFFTPQPLSHYTIVIGEHNIEDDTETNITKTLKPEKIFLHPDFRLRMNVPTNDIALIKIPKIDLRIYTPICLPVPGADYTGKRAWIYGWGSIRFGGPAPQNVLMDVEVAVVSDAEGSKLHNEFVQLTDEQLAVMIFAGEEGKGSCQGDSGGPLSYANPDKNGRHEEIGIVSFGHRCGELPSVFAEVSTLRNFIDITIENN